MDIPLTQEELGEFLMRGEWRRAFDTDTLAQGSRLARGCQSQGISAKLLDTGDAEIAATLTGRDDQVAKVVVGIWRKNGSILIDASCSCGVAINCAHSAAALEYLSKGRGERWAIAVGETPHADKMRRGANLRIKAFSESVNPFSASNGHPAFLLRVERRPEDERFGWLPRIFAHGYALYEGHCAALSPGGALPPIETATGTILRNRQAEMEALQLLYALDLRPGVEEPPPSLRKLAKPAHTGTLWGPDKRKWPHADYYWQRFRHEGAPALERRSWEVRFSPQIGLQPLVFKTDSWRAEMVEESRGWFNLSAGFEIAGEHFDLQPILAVLVENRFLEATEALPEDQEFMVFLPDGRGLALPVGRFRRMLTTLGELIRFKFTNGPIRMTKLDAALLATSAELPIEASEEVTSLARQIESSANVTSTPVPDGLNATLRPYQIEGY